MIHPRAVRLERRAPLVVDETDSRSARSPALRPAEEIRRRGVQPSRCRPAASPAAPRPDRRRRFPAGRPPFRRRTRREIRSAVGSSGGGTSKSESIRSVSAPSPSESSHFAVGVVGLKVSAPLERHEAVGGNRREQRPQSRLGREGPRHAQQVRRLRSCGAAQLGEDHGDAEGTTDPKRPVRLRGPCPQARAPRSPACADGRTSRPACSNSSSHAFQKGRAWSCTSNGRSRCKASIAVTSNRLPVCRVMRSRISRSGNRPRSVTREAASVANADCRSSRVRICPTASRAAALANVRSSGSRGKMPGPRASSESRAASRALRVSASRSDDQPFHFLPQLGIARRGPFVAAKRRGPQHGDNRQGRQQSRRRTSDRRDIEQNPRNRHNRADFSLCHPAAGANSAGRGSRRTKSYVLMTPTIAKGGFSVPLAGALARPCFRSWTKRHRHWRPRAAASGIPCAFRHP